MNFNSKKISFLSAVAITILFCSALFSCTTDEDKPISETYLQRAREVLHDSIVLNARAMMGTVNKTLLAEGCPLKYYMEWRSKDTLNIQIRKFSVGKMPVTVWFSCNCKFMQLNTWEKEEYTEAGWIKFEGSGGQTYYSGNEYDTNKDYQTGTGGAGSVTGYFNALTNEIEFVTEFNVMNMTADVYRQTVDYSRMPTYDKDFTQYEDSLAEYKKEHGLD
jgi:hypothetical protein